MDIDQPIIEICDCGDKFSIEPHGNAYALYFGRCGHRHGYNLARLSEIADNCDLEAIAALLNHDANAQLTQELSDERAEIDGLQTTLIRQGDILTGVANALKGPPDDLMTHSHHDLAEVAEKLTQERDALVEACGQNDIMIRNLAMQVRVLCSRLKKHEPDNTTISDCMEYQSKHNLTSALRKSEALANIDKGK